MACWDPVELKYDRHNTVPRIPLSVMRVSFEVDSIPDYATKSTIESYLVGVSCSSSFRSRRVSEKAFIEYLGVK